MFFSNSFNERRVTLSTVSLHRGLGVSNLQLYQGSGIHVLEWMLVTGETPVKLSASDRTGIKAQRPGFQQLDHKRILHVSSSEDQARLPEKLWIKWLRSQGGSEHVSLGVRLWGN